MSLMERKNKTILLQLLYASPGTSSAVNIWAQNLAKSFLEAGFCPTIQYLSKNFFLPFSSNGVRFKSVALPFAASLKVPKLRGMLYSVIQDHYLASYGKEFTMVAPLGGPYSLKDEQRKVRLVAKAGASYLHPILEHPKVRTGFNDNNVATYLSELANTYDYLMPITEYLRDLFSKHGRIKPSLLNPIIVDTNAFQISASSSKPLTNLLYCGNLGHAEELQVLIDMFLVVHKVKPNVTLHILGGASTSKGTRNIVQKYKKYCNDSGVFSSIVFHGLLTHSEVVQQYSIADAFVLPRPFREYSRAGFPTKLGEYLATGKPVVTTATGDIPVYLKDQHSAYLVEDSTPRSFAEKVIQAIADSSAKRVGLNGAKVAHEHFSIKASAERIASFFNEY